MSKKIIAKKIIDKSVRVKLHLECRMEELRIDDK